MFVMAFASRSDRTVLQSEPGVGEDNWLLHRPLLSSGARLSLSAAIKVSCRMSYLSLGNDGDIPLICPTRQIVFVKYENRGSVTGYYAWGCFRVFLPAPETSGRTRPRHAEAGRSGQLQLSTFSAAIKASCGMS